MADRAALEHKYQPVIDMIDKFSNKRVDPSYADLGHESTNTGGDDQTDTLQSGGNLGKISQHIYGNAKYSNEIAKTNGSDDRDKIRARQEIEIRARQEIEIPVRSESKSPKKRRPFPRDAGGAFRREGELQRLRDSCGKAKPVLPAPLQILARPIREQQTAQKQGNQQNQEELLEPDAHYLVPRDRANVILRRGYGVGDEALPTQSAHRLRQIAGLRACVEGGDEAVGRSIVPQRNRYQRSAFTIRRLHSLHESEGHRFSPAELALPPRAVQQTAHHLSHTVEESIAGIDA